MTKDFRYIKVKKNSVTLIIPEELKIGFVKNFINEISSFDFENYGKIVLNARGIKWIEPLTSLLLISFLQESIISRYKEIIKYYSVDHCINSYAAHIGFYRALRIPVGKAVGEAKGNLQYIPITKIDICELVDEAKSKKILPIQLLEEKSYKLSSILISHIGMKGDNKSLGYAIFEMVRNIFEHSESNYILFCAQVWPRRDELEIAIVDAGIGIKASIDSNYHHKKDRTNVEAIKYALEPGISRSFMAGASSYQDRDDPYANSGFGLYVMHNLCSMLGVFKIISTGDYLEYQSKRITESICNFNGTAIGMRFKLSMLDRIPELRKNLIEVGEKEIKYKKNVIREASAASKSLTY